MPPASPTVSNDPAAHALLRAAYERSYRFPPGFGGFTAALALTRDGERLAGSVRVRSPHDVAPEIEADPAMAAWLGRELGSLAGHTLLAEGVRNAERGTEPAGEQTGEGG